MLLSSAGVALAAPTADLSVQITAPSTVAISTATTYTVTVKNLGPSTATNIQSVVTLPITATSPQVYILGTASSTDTRCSFVNRQLRCTLGTLKKGKQTAFTYSYTAPVSTNALTMTATVSSDLADPVAGNSQHSLTPNLVYPSRALTTANIRNSHCTGTNLSSYFECALFPSSISTHDVTFNGDQTITFTEPGYTGNWSQNAAKTSLFFEYFDGAAKAAEFNGWAINGSNCFDGMTTFFPASTYVSPYHVCVLP